MLITRREFARLRSVSERTVAVWIRNGFIVRESGKIDVEKSNALLEKYHANGGEPRRAESDQTIKQLKAEKLQVEIKIQRLHRDQRIGKLLVIEKEIEEVRLETNILRHRFLGLGPKMAPALSGRKMSAAQVESIICPEVEFYLSELKGAATLRDKAVKAGPDPCDYFWADMDEIEKAQNAPAQKAPESLSELKAAKLRADIADLRDKFIKKAEALMPAQAFADDAERCDRLLFKVWRTLGKRVSPQLANTIQNPGRIAQIIAFEVNEILKSISEGNALDPDAQPKRKTR